MPFHIGGATKEELAGQQFTPPPDGDYIFVVRDIDEHEKEDDETGDVKHSWKVMLRIGPEYDDQAFKGFTRTVYLSTEPGKRGPLFEFLQAIGYTSEELSAGVDIEPASLLNKRLQARVRKQGMYEGQPNMRLNRFRPEGFEESKTALATSGGGKRRGI